MELTSLFRLFESHPDVKRLFLPFHNLSINDMRDNAVVRAHALRVMATVEKAVARLDEPDKLIKILHDLGRRHFTYNAKPEYVDVSHNNLYLTINTNLVIVAPFKT